MVLINVYFLCINIPVKVLSQTGGKQASGQNKNCQMVIQHKVCLRHGLVAADGQSESACNARGSTLAPFPSSLKEEGG